MRTSHDIYKLPDGSTVAIDGMTPPPVGATLWKGYDYDQQFWVWEGKRDTRTLDELRADIKRSLAPAL